MASGLMLAAAGCQQAARASISSTRPLCPVHLQVTLLKEQRDASDYEAAELRFEQTRLMGEKLKAEGEVRGWRRCSCLRSACMIMEMPESVLTADWQRICVTKGCLALGWLQMTPQVTLANAIHRDEVAQWQTEKKEWDTKLQQKLTDQVRSCM